MHVLLVMLGATLASSGSFSAAAAAGPVGPGCSTGSTGVGGSGFATADTGPVPCSTFAPFGNLLTSLSSASGSWITGDFFASTQASALSDIGGHGPSINGLAGDALTDVGIVTLPMGMSSGVVTLGVTGLTGSATGQNNFSSGVMIELEMIGGGSDTVTSVACLGDNLFFGSPCPGSGFGLGLGTLAPIVLTVTNGELLEVDVTVQTTAYAAAYVTSDASANISVDPLYLTLPDGATFDSGITDFLSGPAPPSIPEPGSMLLLGAGLLGLCVRCRFLR